MMGKPRGLYWEWGHVMIRVYFVFEDPLDESGVNLSFADVPTRDPEKAFERVEEAAQSGELWKAMYPHDEDHPYVLISEKMMFLDISASPHGRNAQAILPI
jgi:hypothetical protein